MRKSIITAAVASAALLLTACGAGEGGTSDDPTTGETTAAEETTTEAEETTAAGGLTVWVDETRQAAVEAAAADFTEATGTEVTLVLKNFEDIRADFTAQVPTGEGPDITVGAHDWLGELTSNGVVAPIELGDKAADFEPAAVSAFAFDGQVYGLPYAIENIALIRNTALAPTAPATWDEMLAASAAAGSTYPVLVQMDGENGDPYTFYPLQASFGSSVFAQNADGSYTDELALATGGDEFAAFLAANGPAGTGAFNQDRSYDIVVDAFAKGESPFLIGGPWMLEAIEAGGVEVAIDPIPSAGGQPATPFLGVPGFYLSAESTNGLLANDFMVNYLSTEEAQLALYEAGDRPPALISAAEKAAEDPITAGFIAAGEGASPMPNIPAMASVWAPWGKTQAAIVNGTATDPAAAWAQMITDIQTAIG